MEQPYGKAGCAHWMDRNGETVEQHRSNPGHVHMSLRRLGDS